MTARSPRLRAEIWIVLGLSLGQSAIYAIVSLIAKLTRDGLRNSTATLNASQSPREYLDLTWQVLGIGFSLVPVALALYLLSLDTTKSTVGARLGLDRTHPGRDVAAGAGLAALIGLPGLGLYALGRAVGITANVVPSGLDKYWWTVPVLILAAVGNAVLEEVVVVGYLYTRLRQCAWNVPATLVASALLRGSYHLYQGFGSAIGNVVMGLIFGYWFHRTGRVMPLIIAHTVIDVVAFVGYALFADSLGLR